MARGSEAKSRRKEARKEAREQEKERLLEEVTNEFELNMDADFPTPETEVTDEDAINNMDDLKFGTKKEKDDCCGGGDDDDDKNDADEDSKPVVTKKKKRKKSKLASSQQANGGQSKAPPQSSSAGGGIKTLPLIMLLMLTGTTLLPALLYAGDYISSFMAKNHILGNLGHKLNIGSSPRKRVLSFYEKHDPDKLDEVDKILAKYYGDYPKLIKRLERKYQDYGYFLNWEEDEAPMTLAFEKLDETKIMIQKEFNKRAPQQVKTAVRNISFNLGKLYKKGRVIWKKQVWPILEPVLGVPDGAKEQKRKDRAEAQKRKGRRKANDEYRDDEF